MVMHLRVAVFLIFLTKKVDWKIFSKYDYDQMFYYNTFWVTSIQGVVYYHFVAGYLGVGYGETCKFKLMVSETDLSFWKKSLNQIYLYELTLHKFVLFFKVSTRFFAFLKFWIFWKKFLFFFVKSLHFLFLIKLYFLIEFLINYFIILFWLFL